MLLLTIAVAPMVMASAAHVERRLGPTAAGWVAALPVSFAVAVIAIAADAGAHAASVMTLSAAAHVPAQVAFAIAFAAVLRRRGLVLGAVSGTAAYAVASLLLAAQSPLLGVALAVPALALGPRAIRADRRHEPASSGGVNTAVSCVVAAGFVTAIVLTSRHAGPTAGGIIAAFPALSATLAVAVGRAHGRPASRLALRGLVRSLPCYLAFCLAVALAAP